MSAIQGISGITPPLTSSDVAAPAPPVARIETEVPKVGFGDVLAGLVAGAAAQGHQAGAMAEALARGANDDLHGTMIAGKKADFSLKLVGTVRDKLMDAFQELWRTSV